MPEGAYTSCGLYSVLALRKTSLGSAHSRRLAFERVTLSGRSSTLLAMPTLIAMTLNLKLIKSKACFS